MTTRAPYLLYCQYTKYNQTLSKQHLVRWDTECALQCWPFLQRKGHTYGNITVKQENSSSSLSVRQGLWIKQVSSQKHDEFPALLHYVSKIDVGFFSSACVNFIMVDSEVPKLSHQWISKICFPLLFLWFLMTVFGALIKTVISSLLNTYILSTTIHLYWL